MENTFLEKLKMLGCDTDGAMDRFDNDVELFETCVDIFKEDENFVELKRFLESEDYENAFNAAHTLKGVAANLGLTAISKSVSDVVEKLRSRDYTNIQDMYDLIILNLDNLKSVL